MLMLPNLRQLLKDFPLKPTHIPIPRKYGSIIKSKNIQHIKTGILLCFYTNYR